MSKKIQITTGIIVLAGITILIALFWHDQDSSASNTLSKNTGLQDAQFIEAGSYRVNVIILPNPPKVGKNKIKVIVRDKNQIALNDAAVRAVAEMPAMGSMPAMRTVAEFMKTGEGEFTGELDLGMHGEWPLAVDIETAAHGHSDLTFNLATGRKGLELATATQGDVAHYTCSMHPSVKSAAPGTCPICGMDLVPITHAELNAGTITVDTKRRQLIGVTTDVVKKKKIRKTIKAVGHIIYDETSLSDIRLKYDGWIGKLFSNYVGASVKKGEPLFTVYSPELLTVQEEYLQTRRRLGAQSAENSPLLEAAYRKLRLWDLTPAQIDNLKITGTSQEYVPFLSPVSGTVIEKHIVSGSAVKSAQPVLRIANLSRVWAEAQLYDRELPDIKLGMSATVILPDLQGREFQGTVNYVYPFMEGDTRTVRVRVELDNREGFLRPDMYVHIALRPDFGERLVVPESAVLYAGQSRVAFIDLGDGRLQPRRIKTGVRNRQYIEVIEGLSEGDRVVTSGNFLIAAEAKLKAGIDQW